MLDSMLQQSTIPILEQAVAFGQKRHMVLAGNIANIDTPDYQTRDLPVEKFEQALQRAIQARRTSRNTKPSLPLPLSLDPANQSLSSLNWQGNGNSLAATAPAVPLEMQQARLEDFFPADLNEAQPTNSRNLKFHDGANRSIEKESMEMVKNASLQSFAIEVMRSQMNMLETAISERII